MMEELFFRLTPLYNKCGGVYKTAQARASSKNVCVISEAVCQLMRGGLTRSLYNSAAHLLWSQFISPCAAANVNNTLPTPSSFLHGSPPLSAHTYTNTPAYLPGHAWLEMNWTYRRTNTHTHTHSGEFMLLLPPWNRDSRYKLLILHENIRGDRGRDGGLSSPLTHPSHPAHWLQDDTSGAGVYNTERPQGSWLPGNETATWKRWYPPSSDNPKSQPWPRLRTTSLWPL